MTRRPALSSFLVVLGLTAVLASGPGCSGCGAKPPPVALEETTGPLVFPPPDDGWLERPPIDGVGNSARNDIRLAGPKLQGDRLEVTGSTFELWFDGDVFREGEPAGAPSLTLEPFIAGRTRWTSPRHVTFTADSAFDPDTDYAVSLPERPAPRGRKLAAFRAVFRAIPEVTIAGKTFHYVPKPGVVRPIYLRPIDDRDIGPNTRFVAIYDQPIALGEAQRSLRLTTTAGATLPLALSRPEGEGSFEGETVDLRHVVLASMPAPPPPGTKMKLAAAPLSGDSAPLERELTLGAPPRLDRVACGDTVDCDVAGTNVRGNGLGGLVVAFTNRVHHDEIEANVRVTPEVKNLRVGGWNEEVTIDAAFEPSRTYQIALTGLVDHLGYRVPPTSVTFTTRPRSASAILREGVILVDDQALRDFYVTARNVRRGAIEVWPVAAGADALVAAVKGARDNEAPSGEPRLLPFEVARSTPHTYEPAGVDLRSLEVGHAYRARVRVVEASHGGAMPRPPSADDWTRPSVPLLVFAAKGTPGVHAHAVGKSLLVHTYDLGTGAPLPNVQIAADQTRATTDAAGTTVLALPRLASGLTVTAQNGALGAVLPLDRDGTSAASLYPELAASGDDDPTRDVVGAIVTDRGIYRPGSTIRMKAYVRRPQADKLAALANTPVRVRLTDPMGTDVVDEQIATTALGTVARDLPIAPLAHTGRYRVRVELDDADHTLVVQETVRIADFEVPRFKVDVDAPADMPAGRWRSRVVGRYMFGAPMEGGRVNWELRKSRKPVDGGALAKDGFVFDRESLGYAYGEEPAEYVAPAYGDGKLAPDGSLEVDTELGPLTKGPTEVTFIGTVTDESYRTISNRTSQLRHPFQRYAGLRLPTSFGGVGALSVSLGAVDTKGAPVAGAPLEARLERLEWKRSTQTSDSGATVESWKVVPTVVSTCSVTSTPAGSACTLTTKHEGEHRVVARIDGRDDASLGYYAWGKSDGPSEPVVNPTEGRKLSLVADKRTYAPGDTAKVLVRSPFAEATAILTVERGGLLSHETRHVKGASTVFDVPLSLGHAPFAHAAVTLLPAGTTSSSYRVGVVRLPVSLDDAHLAVAVSSDKKTYETRDTATITVEVKRKGAPVPNADVTFALVDEAVLRLTDFHATDPTSALHPQTPLGFDAFDSRELLFRKREQAHVAGGDGGDERDAADTRRDFVETAAWHPTLTTDARGRATLKVTLPDNLTEFRMMATVLGEDGAAGAAEDSFVVTKPLLLEPVVPAFTLRGDTFELAAMVHNNTTSTVKGVVKIDGVPKPITLGPQSRERVGITVTADKTRDVFFALETDGKARDRVLKTLRVGLPGTEEHPQLSAVFRGKREVTVQIPEDAVFDRDAKLMLRVGAALYPELGQRLQYLLDYPHGCLEQTTSGLLPLLAARNLLPWTGAVPLDEGERKKRIKAGVDRIATMRTDGGGLAYWPGGTSPDLYATVYATRALLLARAEGIEIKGLLPGALGWLGNQLNAYAAPEMRVAVGEVLAAGGTLDPSAADMLFDAREKLDVFGTGSLALALASVPGQEDRTAKLVDALEASFDDAGMPSGEHGKHDAHYWGSADRDRAQTLITLMRLRPQSKLASALAHRLLRSVDGYTTHATAWSLTALATFVGDGAPRGGVDVKVRAKGVLFDRLRALGGENKEVGVSLAELAGRTVVIELTGDDKVPSAFAMEARYVRPQGKSTRYGRRSRLGPSVYRVYTTATGAPLDVAQVKAGDMVRVALRVEVPEIDPWRASHLAVTDMLPAGFQPVIEGLASNSGPPSLDETHPFHEGLSQWGSTPSHVDVRSDRVNVYFDRVYGGRAAYATFLVRAVTPGDFLAPPARGELMYEPGSEGYSESTRVVVR